MGQNGPKDQCFRLLQPERAVSGVIFASPHSGRDYPESMLEATNLSARQIRSSEDAFVDRLLAAAPNLGGRPCCWRGSRGPMWISTARRMSSIRLLLKGCAAWR